MVQLLMYFVVIRFQPSLHIDGLVQDCDNSIDNALERSLALNHRHIFQDLVIRWYMIALGGVSITLMSS